MDLRKRPLIAGMTALLFSGYVSSLGLGDIRLHSTLNEPLRAEIPLLSVGELSSAEILAGLAPLSDFEKAGIDRELILSSLTFSVDLDNRQGPLLRVSSQKPIREPYLNFLVDVQWPDGRLQREYTLLFDLPVYGAQTQYSDAYPVQEAVGGPGVAASPGLSSGGQYRVVSGETLWRIASNLPGELPVRQKMADILHLNPEAFIQGDMTRIREGALLRLPDYGSAGPSQSLPPGGGGRLTLQSPDVMSETRQAAPSRREIDEIQEELARTLRENEQLKRRLASLEEQVTTMQSLISLESGELRAAQLLAEATSDGDMPAVSDHDELGSSGAAHQTSRTASDESEVLPSSVDVLTAHENAAAERGPEADAVAEAGGSQAEQQAEIKSTAHESGRKTSNGAKQEVGNVGAYLKLLLGVLVVLVGAIVYAVVRKKRGQGEERPRLSEPQITPVAPAQDTPVPGDRPAAVSVDEIVLREEDDLFSVQPSTETDEHSGYSDSAVDELELDLSEFDLGELIEEPSGQASTSRAADPVADLNLDDEFDFLGGIDEGDTQLELAQAYVEMGDNAGAREILNEVVETGSDAQRERAKAMLAEIS